eukprot:CAMPEP_0183316316 /NCGR_PEP_ID=MMETSP0160_2-20130417/54565_1 /TAXON_ID=2839 ORGANISM="Odontella Sinensis, Strain Grunow 1884" /NCGR_SAMPLE_ID=MMETSP0160_2 /ASSEMBLY_ACC=CAM_ASM_000250 /LENGTH=367 /DNA_ID=CAMNT_0025482081 /DNA_START=27 /DNA_END=1130 /DNA_ORIENTATION=-
MIGRRPTPPLLFALAFLGPALLKIAGGVGLALASSDAAPDGSTPPELVADDAVTAPHVGEYIAETGFYQSIELEGNGEPLYATRSEYQEIRVVDSEYYGKILVLDGVVQLTERDADSYNEMMAHIPMMAVREPKKVLVIGGGDGYVLSEVLKHPFVVHVDHVDLDGEVVKVCRDHFSWGKAWDDPRATLHIADGAAFVRNAPDETYDVIIQDSSDPWTWGDDGEVVDLPSGVLYSKDHFGNLLRILKPGGALNFQAETFNIPSDLEGISEWRKLVLGLGFESARYGSLTISSYPTGQIGFLLCQKPGDDDAPNREAIQKRWDEMVRVGNGTTYYQPKLQTSSFDLPLWVEKSIYFNDKVKSHLSDEF